MAKLKDYRKNQRGKIRPQSSSGVGVGYATHAEKSRFKKQKTLIFNLINLTPIAHKISLYKQVYPFEENRKIYIVSSNGIIGEAPPKSSKQIFDI